MLVTALLILLSTLSNGFWIEEMESMSRISIVSCSFQDILFLICYIKGNFFPKQTPITSKKHFSVPRKNLWRE